MDTANSTAAASVDMPPSPPTPSPPPLVPPAPPPIPRGQLLSLARKAILCAVLGLMTLALTFTSTAYSSSSQSVMREFGISRELFVLGISLYVLGFAVGLLVFGPLSQRIGKRPVYVGSYIVFTGSCFGVSEAPNIGVLLFFRFLAGTSGCSSLNNVPSSFKDIANAKWYTRIFAIYAITSFAGPGLGGVVGAYADSRLGWRWNMRIQALVVALSTVLCIVAAPETAYLPPQPIERIKEKVKQEGKGHRLRQAGGALGRTASASYRLVKGPIMWLILEPVVAVICVYLSLLYAVLYAFFVEIPIVFQQIRGFTLEELGLVYFSIIVGFTIGIICLLTVQRAADDRARYEAETTGVKVAPETLLFQARYTSLLPPAGLFIFAWTGPYTGVHWIAPCIGTAVFCCGCLCIFTCFIPYLVAYSGGPEAPTVLAAGTMTRSAAAAALPLVMAQMIHGLTVQGATSLLGGIALVLAPMPAILTRYGPALRAKSRMVHIPPPPPSSSSSPPVEVEESGKTDLEKGGDEEGFGRLGKVR